jgi:hypothetical protein
MGGISLLNRDTHPDVWCPGQMPGQLSKPFGSFREQLECVLGGLIHNRKHALDIFKRKALMKNVAQAVYEVHRRFARPERLLEP